MLFISMLYYKISKLHTKENKLPFSRVEVVGMERFWGGGGGVISNHI